MFEHSHAKNLSGALLAFILIATASLPCPAAETDAFLQRRAKLVAEYDRNRDGRLDAAEREQMRLALQEKRLRQNSKDGPPDDFLADYDTNKNGVMDDAEWGPAREAEYRIIIAKYDTQPDGRLDAQEMDAMLKDVRSVPMRWARDYFSYLLKYDTNKNGEFDGDEYATAEREEGKVATATYDSDGDGTLDQQEKGKLLRDLKQGVIVGFYTRFVSALLGGKSRGDTGYLEAQKQLLAFDRDGDGIASAEELQRIREARARKQ